MTREPVKDHLGDATDTVSNWNIANGLTFVRLLLVPVFVWVALSAFDTGNSTGAGSGGHDLPGRSSYRLG